MPSAIPDSLIEAYRAADYRVDVVPELVLKVDRYSPGLALLYERWGVTSAAFITAWNPHSQPASRAENTERDTRLFAELRGLGLTCMEGQGSDPAGHWPSEDSLLVLGLARPSAMEIGERYAQNAIVWADADAIPRLVLLR